MDEEGKRQNGVHTEVEYRVKRLSLRHCCMGWERWGRKMGDAGCVWRLRGRVQIVTREAAGDDSNQVKIYERLDARPEIVPIIVLGLRGLLLLRDYSHGHQRR